MKQAVILLLGTLSSLLGTCANRSWAFDAQETTPAVARQTVVKQASEIKSEDAQSHREHALSLLSQKHNAEAAREYVAFLQAARIGGREEGFDAMAFASRLEEAGQLQEAVTVYRQILVATTTESAFERCYLFNALDPSQYVAFPEFAASIQKLRPYCTQSEHYDRGLQLLREGKSDSGVQELERQVAQNPLFQGTYDVLARVYRSRGEDSNALAVIRKYFEVETDQLERCKMYRHLGTRSYYERFDKEFADHMKQECEK